MSGDNWVHVSDANMVWNYSDEEVHHYLTAWISCCGLELRASVGYKSVCPHCQAIYSVGFQRAVLRKVAIPETVPA